MTLRTSNGIVLEIFEKRSKRAVEARGLLADEVKQGSGVKSSLLGGGRRAVSGGGERADDHVDFERVAWLQEILLRLLRKE